MSEWQPVRLKSIEQQKLDCPAEDVEDGLEWPAGKIIRVREFFGDAEETCGGRVFEIHPQDEWDEPGTVLCEHQIQAD